MHEPAHQTDDGIERSQARDIGRTDGQDLAEQNPLDVLGALRRAIHDEHRRRRRDDIQDADECFSIHISGKAARERQQRCTQRREQQRVGVSGSASRRESVGERDRRAERRKLRQREIGEHDVTAQHMHAEIGVDQHKNDRSREGKQQQRKRVAHESPACVERVGKRCTVMVEHVEKGVHRRYAPRRHGKHDQWNAESLCDKAGSALGLVRLVHDRAHVRGASFRYEVREM